MRKQLGILTTLMVLAITALCWAGCSNYGSRSDCGDVYYDCAPACPAPCKPECKPACEPCQAGNVSQISCDGIVITASQPKLCILGDNYALDLEICALIDVCHVEVNAMLPEGVTLVSSDPQGAVQTKNMITWQFDGMKRGESKKSRVMLRADREGNLCVCFCVTAVPVQFCTVLCAKPVLECSKVGPCEVCPGDPAHFTITVTNKGTCAAEDVVVVDTIPDAFEHSSGQRRLTFRLGTLEPCETKEIGVCLTAVKRGDACNMINVTACNANPVSCQFCTKICKECVELEKTGPKEKKIGENADYQIVVRNPGDKSLTQVVVCDQAPSQTSIVEAPGAVVNGNQAVWRWDELKPGESKTVTLTLTTCTPGYYVNRVSVDNCQRCRDCKEAGTRWKGTPALNACFSDAKDPICLGDFNTYALTVTNQGSEPDSNLVVVIEFPKELTPVSTSGDTEAKISGQTVTFAPVKQFGPSQSAEFIVRAQAKERGDARINAKISSDTIKNPLMQQESTIIN